MFVNGVYEGNEPYIFAHYANSDTKTVKQILSALEHRSFRIWYDTDGSGSEQTAHRLENCSCYLAFVTKDMLRFREFPEKIRYAIEHDKNPLIIYMDNSVLSPGMQLLLGSVQAMYYDRHSTMESFLEEICRSTMLQRCCMENTPSAPQMLNSAEIAYRKGKEYIDRNNQEEGTRWFQKAAELGHVQAQYELGKSYLNGYGIKKDPDNAVRWFQKATQQDYAPAYRQLGDCYRWGWSLPKSNSEAMRHYHIAAQKGDVHAQYELGVLYADGYIVKKNYKEAAKWFCRSAEQGDLLSKQELGECYYYGRGVKKNYKEAARLFQETNNRLWLARCYCYGRGLPMDRYRAVAIFREEAEKGKYEAQFECGWCYEKGYGVRKSKFAAKKWYEEYASHGQSVFQARMKRMLGIG